MLLRTWYGVSALRIRNMLAVMWLPEPKCTQLRRSSGVCPHTALRRARLEAVSSVASVSFTASVPRQAAIRRLLLCSSVRSAHTWRARGCGLSRCREGESSALKSTAWHCAILRVVSSAVHHVHLQYSLTWLKRALFCSATGYRVRCNSACGRRLVSAQLLVASGDRRHRTEHQHHPLVGPLSWSKACAR